jgi:hypothetical protein
MKKLLLPLIISGLMLNPVKGLADTQDDLDVGKRLDLIALLTGLNEENADTLTQKANLFCIINPYPLCDQDLISIVLFRSMEISQQRTGSPWLGTKMNTWQALLRARKQIR